MWSNAVSEQEKRVLLSVPTTRDREITAALLKSEGLACLAIPTLLQLSQEIEAGAGAILLTEEAITADGIDDLIAALDRQPQWSDLPVVMLMQGGVGSPAAARVLRSLRNVTLLERPAPMRSVVSAVQAATRARGRQYQIRQQIREIREARAESERAGRIKDEFLATLSHELRTPLNAILGWAQLLRHAGDDRETIDEGVAVIERNARIQVQLIEDLLDMSRITSGKILLTLQLVDVASFIDAAIETVKPAADAKEILLQKQLDARRSPILGDRGRLQQVVWNLLSNAIKFTPKGGTVRVTASQKASHLEISVTDTGHGIGAEFLPHVFERFRQADASSTRAHGGLGLGLAIVKSLVELHGGEISAASEGVDRGSTFTLKLPLATVEQVTSQSPRLGSPTAGAKSAICDSLSLRGMKVLVVDDEPDARNLMRRVLEDCDATVLTANSATEALEAITRERPDVLVSDIGMPAVDGYELLRRIRALGVEKDGRIPAIALTAFARSEDRTRALLAGYLVHVAKPVNPYELVATIATVAGRTGVNVL